MERNEKIPYVEYFTKLLVEWHQRKSKNSVNDLSILKVLKLLFFASAVNTKSESENTLLDNVFDNFYAMPYGHVESDVYEIIKNNQLQNVEITNNNSTVLNQYFEVPSNPFKNDIEKGVIDLEKSNPNIILASSFELVELSHAWYSWLYNYSEAKKSGVNSRKIPIDQIKQEEKIFMI